MQIQVCAHCGTPIRDSVTQVEREGKVYCCSNCSRHLMEHGRTEALLEHCAHCQVTIFDPSTQVREGSKLFCCRNCALAMGAA